MSDENYITCMMKQAHVFHHFPATSVNAHDLKNLKQKFIYLLTRLVGGGALQLVVSETHSILQSIIGIKTLQNPV